MVPITIIGVILESRILSIFGQFWEIKCGSHEHKVRTSDASFQLLKCRTVKCESKVGARLKP